MRERAGGGGINYIVRPTPSDLQFFLGTSHNRIQRISRAGGINL